MKRTLTFAAMLTLGAVAFTALPAAAQSSFSVVIGNAPPAPRFESVPAPRHGYEWAPGYWNWDGQRHVWMSGHWENARDGYRFQRSEWVRDPNGYRLEQGGWQQVSDRDHYDVRIAPPAPRYERVPRPRAGYIWEPGHWELRGNRHEWITGLWIAERPGYVYTPHNWYQRDGRWYLEQGRWNRGDHRSDRRYSYQDGRRRDSDRDGVPDRYDHDRDNDGVPNRYDRDRDGDGVRNEYDRRPDNPRR
jgi:hypothetical protein